MPIKPGKDESQSDFLKRCVPEMMGDGKRPQDQAVAACLDIWREAHPGAKPAPKELAAEIASWQRRLRKVLGKADDDNGDGKQPYGDVEYADPGYQSDGKKRYPIDTEDHIRAAWNYINKPKNQEPYTDEQVKRIKARIVAAWKDKIDADGPPAADDKSAMVALRREVVALAAKDYAPEPDDDESHDDFIDRCVDEMTDNDDSMDDDDAEEACQLAWDEWSDERGAGLIMHKTHAAPPGGMQFVLSDATPDRFGDIIETGGWDLENFKRNPVALFAHDKTFPIGTWRDLRVDDKELRGNLVLAPKGTSARIDEIRRLIDADILRAVSVGFRPLESAPINIKDPWGGTRFTKHELVEASLVAIPANANALAVAKSLNISPSTVRFVFGEHADVNVKRREFGNDARRGEDADRRRAAGNGKGEDAETTRTHTGEHAENHRNAERKPMLLSKRITDSEKHVLALQDQLDKHLESIDDTNPTEEQMVLTEDLTSKIEAATRHLNSLKAIEAKNASGATDAGGDVHRRAANGTKPPAGIVLRGLKKPEPLDYFWRACVVRAKAKIEAADIDVIRHKIYGDDEATRVVCDIVLKAASAPAMTTVTGWAAELVQQIYADFMQVLLPLSVLPRLEALGLALSFGAAGRIIIPTRNLTPAVSGSFVGEGAPIPVRQTQFASQVLTPKKAAVISTWTRELDEHSIPAIEGLLRQAVLEDTAIALDTVLLGNGAATAIAPPGLRSYQAGLTPSAAATPFDAFVADYKALFGSLLTLTLGNVRKPVIMLNPLQTLDLSTMQPPAAAAPLWPLQAMLAAGKVGKADLIESATVPPGMAIMVDAADFTTAGAEGPRMEISDQATLHMEDTAPQDIVSGPSGTPVAATPVKSMFQTDSLALRLILFLNWIMRRPVVSWMSGVTW